MNAFSLMLIFVCSAVTVLSMSEEHQKIRENRKKAVEECRKENPNVSEDDFGAVHKIDSPKNEIQHCMLNCVYEKMGIVKDGKLVNEELDRILRAKVDNDPAKVSIVDGMSKLCQGELEKNYGSIKKCEVANEFHSCMVRKHMEMQQQQQAKSK